jgi:uncharacterized protein DUF1588/uncharacterized protein DUF1585/uncharacterized protein DUF1592/cytochrome c
MRRLAVLVAVLLVGAAPPQAERPAGGPEGVGPFLKQYCAKCHGPEKRKGDLTLQDLGAKPSPGPTLEVWKKVLDQLADGQMPPEEATQPPKDQRRQAILRIEADLRQAGVRVDDGKAARPSKGNRVDHDALFSEKGKGESSTPGRLWRLTAPAYEELFQKVNSELKLGFKSYGRSFRAPWELSTDEGFRDYASSHRIDEPEIELHLRNSTKVAKVLASRVAQGQGVPELQALVKPGGSVPAGVDKAVRALLGRDPSTDERERYAGFFRDSLKRDGAETALELLFVAILFHPEVMYRLEMATGTGGRTLLAPRELARAIAFALTDRAPDAELLQAAAAGKLVRREDVRAQVQRVLDAEVKRILGDPLDVQPRILRFFREYFGYAEAENVFKDLPTLKEAGLGGRRNYWNAGFFVRDADRMIASALDKDRNVLYELLTTTKTPVLTRVHKDGRQIVHPAPKGGDFNSEARLALGVYELEIKPQDWAADKAFALPEAHRLGILTHPAWLVAHSTNFENHAIGRGRWIREKLLGGNIPDIPVTVDAKLPEEPHTPLRERMRVTREAYCWKCHRNMDPLGLPFEMYDHFGRFRTTELGKPVETKGDVAGSGDARLDGPVKDALDLIRRLAASERVEQVFVRHVFRYFLGRNETLDDGPTLAEAHRAYRREGGSMKALIVSLLASEAFLYRTSP